MSQIPEAGGIGPKRFIPLLLFVCHAAVLGVVLWIVDYRPGGQIREMLKSAVPVVLGINLALILAAAALCFRNFREAFGTLAVRERIQLALVVMAALLLASLAAPRTHRIYYDEDIYANTGQAIAESGIAAFSKYGVFEDGRYVVKWSEYNKEPSGFPFLAAVVFKLLGVDELYVFFLNNLLFAASVLIVFFIARHLARRFFPALCAAIGFTLIPHNIIWSNTGAAEPAAAFWAGAVVLALLNFSRSRRSRDLFILAVLLPFACWMRPESLLIFFWAGLALLLLDPKIFGHVRTWAFALLSLSLTAPLLLHLAAVSGESWGAQGTKFALSYILGNLSVNGPYYFNNETFPIFVTLLAVAGAAAGTCPKSFRLLVFLWFLFFWAIFIPFYAGSYRHGPDVRFSLLSFMPLAILAGLGAERIRSFVSRWIRGEKKKGFVSALLILLLVFPFVQFLPLVTRVRDEGWAMRFDHQYALQFAREMPRHSIILTHNPTMFNLWGRDAIQVHAGVAYPDVMRELFARYSGQVYFHYNYWCNAPTIDFRRECEEIIARYDLEEITRARKGNVDYVLLRIKGEKP